VQPLKSRLVGDFSLNVANSLTAGWMFGHGLHAVTPSYDLNREELTEMLRHTPADRFEVTVHQHIPSFHMEHCVFAAFLSTGTSYRDCGHPCEKFRVELEDERGTRHPLKADAECRNTMFTGAAQSAAALVEPLRELGVAKFRIEGLFESAADLRKVVTTYADLLEGTISIAELTSRLTVSEKYGVTEGQLVQLGKYRDRKKESVADWAAARAAEMLGQ
jgi:putative protease